MRFCCNFFMRSSVLTCEQQYSQQYRLPTMVEVSKVNFQRELPGFHLKGLTQGKGFGKQITTRLSLYPTRWLRPTRPSENLNWNTGQSTPLPTVFFILIVRSLGISYQAHSGCGVHWLMQVSQSFDGEPCLLQSCARNFVYFVLKANQIFRKFYTMCVQKNTQNQLDYQELLIIIGKKK